MPAALITLTPGHCFADPLCSEGASSGIIGNSQDIDEAMSTPTARMKQRPSSSGVGLMPSAPSVTALQSAVPAPEQQRRVLCAQSVFLVEISIGFVEESD